MNFRRTFRLRARFRRWTTRSAAAINVQQRGTGFRDPMIVLADNNPACSSLYDVQHGRIIRVYLASAIVNGHEMI
jgi:hypothetical protein